MHSFNFIALSVFIKTHLSQREREKIKRREKKVVVGDSDVKKKIGGEREMETESGDKDFPEMPDNRNCCFELPPPWGEGLIGGRQGW